jgi:hypothetical protein
MTISSTITARKTSRLPLGVLLLAMLASLPAAVAAEDLPMPVDEVIAKFVQKETEFTRAREAYTYRQTVRILEYNDAGGVRGKYEIIQDVIFGPNGERTERVVYAPVSTLQNILLTPQDMQDMRDVQPFVMTTKERPDYDIRYLGPEKVDEIETFVFSVKPKKMEKGARYFEGQIWVDQRDLQIVKTYGKGVGIRKKNSDEQFPRFETYRNQIDGKYWFPVYTRADDVLHFENNDQKIRMVMKYEDYKQFKSESDIKFGDVVGEPDQPATPPQATPTPQAQPK